MIDRRHFLKTGTAAGTLGFAVSFPGLGARAQATPPLRRSLQGMDLDDPVLVTLRDFVTQMQDPSRAGQPVSWTGFADIHGDATGFNRCPHGNWYFLPWHRSYIRMYEAAARALTGDDAFAMPYWDWTADPGFPAAFGDDTFDGQPNPLFLPGRLLQTGDPIPPDVAGPDVLDTIFASQSFEEFGSSRAFGQDSTDPMWVMARGTSGELESNPHDNVHCIIRLPVMCSGASPQDPIFQMHHCNIDRIWALWIAQGGADSPDPLWLNMPFTNHFFAPDGTAYTDVVGELLEVEPLGYTYGLGAPSQPPVYDPGRLLYLSALFAGTGDPSGALRRQLETPTETAAPDNPLTVELSSETVDLDAAIAAPAAAELRSAGIAQPRVYAFLRGLAPANSETTQMRVFVDLSDANATTPTVGNPHFVTSIGFFGPVGRHGDHDMRKNVTVDLTPALRALAAAGDPPSNDLTLQLVPVGHLPDDDAASVTVGEIELAVV